MNRKILAMLLLVAMLFSLLPVSVLAEDEDAIIEESIIAEEPADEEVLPVAAEEPAEEPVEDDIGWPDELPNLDDYLVEPAEEEAPAEEETPAEPEEEIPDEEIDEIDEALGFAIIAEGTIGDISWEVWDYGKLHVTGSGSIPDFPEPSTWSDDASAAPPWYQYKDTITSISISATGTRIGNNAFYGLENAVWLYLFSSDITDIGDGAFAMCSGMIYLDNGSDGYYWEWNIRTIGDRAFHNCPITGFYCMAGADLLAKVETIGAFAFAGNKAAVIRLGQNLVSIGSQAFANSQELTEITIPKSVKEIGDNPFARCPKLTKIYVEQQGDSYYFSSNDSIYSNIWKNLIAYPTGKAGPAVIESLTETIYPYAFAGSKLSSVKFSSKVSDISTCAFQGCQDLSNVYLAQGVKNIGDNAFEGCTALHDIVIYKEIEWIGNYAFWNSGLTDVYYTGTEQEWEAEAIGMWAFPEGVTFHFNTKFDTLYSGTLENGIEWSIDSVGRLVITGTGAIPNYYVGEINSNPAPWYQYRDEVNSITVGEGITEIGDYALFAMTSAASVELPTTLDKIGTFSFASLFSCNSIVIPNNVTYIGEWAFSGGEMCSITLPANLIFLGKASFNQCGNLEEIYLPAKLNSMSGNPFYDCPNLTYIEIDPDNKSFVIYNDSIYSADLSALYCVPASYAGTYETYAWLVSIRAGAFHGCHYINEIYLNEGLLGIEDSAFVEVYNSKDEDNSLKSIVIPSTVLNIGSGAFYACWGLEEITLPRSLKGIGNGAFASGTELTDVYFCGTEEQWNSIPDKASVLFYSDMSDEIAPPTIHFNCSYDDQLSGGMAGGPVGYSLDIYGKLELYGNGEMYDFDDENPVPWADYIEDIDYVVIEEGVTVIGDNAFNGARSLTYIDIPASVTEIGASAFEGCTGLREIRFGGSGEEWLSLTRNGGSGLLSTSTAICKNGGNTEYSGIAGDKIIWLLNEEGTLTFIGSGDMYDFGETYGSRPGWYDYRSRVTYVDFYSNITSIGDYAFFEEVADVAYDEFDGHYNFKGIDLPLALKSIGQKAFLNNVNVEGISMSDSVTEIGYGAFENTLGLQYMELPSGLTTIERCTFYNSGIKYIVMPDSVTVIRDEAFDASELETVRFLGTRAEWNSVNVYPRNETLLSAKIITNDDIFEIITQPDDVEAVIGELMAFSVEVNGDVAGYNWQYSSDGGSKWNNLSVNTNPTAGTADYEVKCTTKNSAYLYRCRVTNTDGEKIYSSIAAVELLPKVQITEHPVSMIAGKYEYINFHVEATGKNLSYKWYYSKDNGSTWIPFNIANNQTAGTDTYTILAKTTYDGWRYKCVVTDAGGNKATSKSALFRYGQALTIVSSSGDVVTPAGKPISYTVNAKGVGLTYKWQYSKDGGQTWTSFSNNDSATTATLELTSQSKYNRWLFHCIVTDALYNKATSEPACYYVGNGAIITGEGSEASAAAANHTIYYVDVAGEHTSRWQYSKDGGVTWVNYNLDKNPTAGTDRMILEVTSSNDGWLVRCKVKATSTGAVMYSDVNIVAK